MLVCALFAQSCTRDRGCSAHPAFPAPSFGEILCKLGRFMLRERGFISDAKHRHCERSEAIHLAAERKNGLLTWGMCVSRISSHLFVRLQPPLRPDRGLCRMARADQVKAGPLGPPRSGLALS